MEWRVIVLRARDGRHLALNLSQLDGGAELAAEIVARVPEAVEGKAALDALKVLAARPVTDR